MTTMFEPRLDPRKRIQTTPSKRKLRTKAVIFFLASCAFFTVAANDFSNAQSGAYILGLCGGVASIAFAVLSLRGVDV